MADTIAPIANDPADAGKSSVQLKLYRSGSLVTVAVTGGRRLGIKYNGSDFTSGAA